MAEKVTMWRTEDGEVFATEQEAMIHQSNKERLELIQAELAVDPYLAHSMIEFIEKYTKGWKDICLQSEGDCDVY